MLDEDKSPSLATAMAKSDSPQSLSPSVKEVISHTQPIGQEFPLTVRGQMIMTKDITPEAAVVEKERIASEERRELVRSSTEIVVAQTQKEKDVAIATIKSRYETIQNSLPILGFIIIVSIGMITASPYIFGGGGVLVFLLLHHLNPNILRSQKFFELLGGKGPLSTSTN